MATADISSDPTTLYHQLDEYPWDTDTEFQGGLRAILGSVNEPSQVEHLTLRAKCYYYARKAGTPVDFDGYKRWVEGAGQSTTGTTTITGANTNGESLAPITSTATASTSGGGNGMADAPKPASFAEICDMIAEGKPIPGIKDIPDTILEGQASDSSRAQRKKPWEKEPSAEQPSWMT